MCRERYCQRSASVNQDRRRSETGFPSFSEKDREAIASDPSSLGLANVKAIALDQAVP
jgi:hypothetical protein